MSDDTQLRTALMRLRRDLRSLKDDPPNGCSAAPISEHNMFLWTATIVGPEETPWEGGIFSLRLNFPKNYPTKPPTVRFTCDIFHPNVYSDGTLCLDIIQDAWSPVHSVASVLTSIQSLLCDPNPDSPANPEAARLFTDKPRDYKRRVRRYAAKTVE